jgi:RNA polymerase sigma-B factor
MDAMRASEMTRSSAHAAAGAADCICGRPDCARRFACLAGLPPGARRRELRNALVEDHLALADAIAARYRRTWVPGEDLRQVAAVGLLEAVDRFDVRRGVRFPAFAGPTISGTVKKYFRDALWPVHVPRSVKVAAVAVQGTADVLEQELARTPDRGDLARATGLPEARVGEALGAARAWSPASLDAPGGAGFAEEAGAPEPGYERVEAAMTVRALLPRLRGDERRALEFRYFDGLSQKEIACRCGVSQAQVSRLQRRGLAGLRRLVGEAA